MDITIQDSVKEELIKVDQNFKHLAEKHQEYEKRLTEIADLTYPNDEELLEESVLKKKKLAVKDEMYSLIQQHTTEA